MRGPMERHLHLVSKLQRWGGDGSAQVLSLPSLALPAIPSAHRLAPKALVPALTRLCLPSQRLKRGQRQGVFPSPAGLSCCPTSAQHGLGAPWSAFWAMSCPPSPPLSPRLPCLPPFLLPGLAGATAPPLRVPPGALLPGSPPNFSFPHWEPSDLWTSVPGETPASPASPYPCWLPEPFLGSVSSIPTSVPPCLCPHVHPDPS